MWITVAKANEIAPGKCKIVTRRSLEYAVFNVAGEYYCIDNICPHAGGSLGEGIIEDNCVTCTWHYWQFDVKTGEMCGNQHVRVARFEVREFEGEIQIDVTG